MCESLWPCNRARVKCWVSCYLQSHSFTPQLVAEPGSTLWGLDSNRSKRMSTSQEEAMKIFWLTPELVEKLVPFLDAKSLSSLAQASKFTAQVLQGDTVWSKLVLRCVLYTENRPEHICSLSQLGLVLHSRRRRQIWTILSRSWKRWRTQRSLCWSSSRAA